MRRRPHRTLPVRLRPPNGTYGPCGPHSAQLARIDSICASTPAETAPVPPRITTVDGSIRRSSLATLDGTVVPGTSSSGPGTPPATGPPPRASGKVTPVAMNTVEPPVNVPVEMATAVAYRSAPERRSTLPLVA